MWQQELNEKDCDKKKTEDKSGGRRTVTGEGGRESVSLLVAEVVLQEDLWVVR